MEAGREMDQDGIAGEIAVCARHLRFIDDQRVAFQMGGRFRKEWCPTATLTALQIHATSPTVCVTRTLTVILMSVRTPTVTSISTA
jgi:hypothetical protein